ncbi:ALI_collapsed_G0049000.mRNA.1.CDS.1 [Saccharomyces cerevisiae]|nr:ALI_HP1_G0027090.mRNA.1.CDS.1 [Saccharomyces cerevisiae]CAI6876760.1 ALI_collapsed_G0049000.mRNA.1.CDS.1 [Saccharomyces cerevisiae]
MPLVDTYHGLYSPSLFFAIIGLGWVIKKIACIHTLMIREEPKITSDSPFEYYAKLNKIDSCHNQIFAHIMSKISSELGQNASSWEKVNFSNGLMDLRMQFQSSNSFT